MNPKELLDEWTQGEQNGMRPKRVQVLRDDIMEATDEYIPRRISEIEAILGTPQRRGVITRKLREAVGEEEENGDDD